MAMRIQLILLVLLARGRGSSAYQNIGTRPSCASSFETKLQRNPSALPANKRDGAGEPPVANSVTPQPTNSRRLFLSSALTTAGVLVAGEEVLAQASIPSINTLPWEKDPINKRSGVTVSDAEKAGYSVAFVTYLSRFLLNFDSNCQRWWFSTRIPQQATVENVELIRLEQFARFAASVQVGLIGFAKDGGPCELLEDLVRRYGTLPGKDLTVVGDDIDSVKTQKRLARSARRHIALAFALMEKNQPTKDITRLLASVDDARITSVELQDENLSGYAIGEEPVVVFPSPQAGDEYESAQGRAVLKPTGKILRFELVDAGSGYSGPPVVSISAPRSGGAAAEAQAKIIASGPNKGSIESVRLVDAGSGYSEDETIAVIVSSPKLGAMSRVAAISTVLDMAIERVEITKEGNGYAVEKALKVFVEPPSGGAESDRRQIGASCPLAENSSFTAFRRDSDKKELQLEEEFQSKYNVKPAVTGTLSGLEGFMPPLPFWSGKSSSAELLRLLPSGIGLDYDQSLKRYVLAVDTDFMKKYPAVLQQSSNRPLGPEFGPRGRAPIERNMQLGFSEYLRFALSGAICASGVHLALTPLDVVKTKGQTNPEKYPNIGASIKTIWNEEGPQTLFTGWLPTYLGYFLSSGTLYALTEYIRRTVSERAGVDAVALEVPIILLAAAVASAIGAVLSCPFEAVRIRTVAQPEYAANSVAVLKRMLDEEGLGSLLNAIPVFLVRNVPYAMTKFTIFDVSTEWMYRQFPAAQEELKLSLLVSLVGGVLGGTAAAVISNPADALISEMKKAQSDISPQEAASNMLDRAGPSAFFVGLPLRMVFYSLVASLTFVSYEAVRFLLGIGSDDLKLYLDVLGGALTDSPLV